MKHEWALTDEVTSLNIVVALLVSRGLGSSNEGNASKPKKSLRAWLISLRGRCMCSLCPTCRALGVSPYFLVSLPRVLVATFFVFLDRGLPFAGGIFQLTYCRYTKVSKSWVRMSNNYTRDGGFLALLSPWSLALKIASFAVGRLGVDEIKKS
jgi:hypothetical protein